MFTLPQKEFRMTTTCPGSDSIQDLPSNKGDGLERECSRKPDQKLLKFYGVGDPAAELSSRAPTCPLEAASLNGSGIQRRRATGPTTWMNMMRTRTPV